MNDLEKLKPTPTAIDAIEFFEDGDKDYMQVNIDQLYNMPSIISSKVNIDSFSTKLHTDLECTQLNHLGNVSNSNQLNILTNLILNAVESNYNRFLCYCVCFAPFKNIHCGWRHIDNKNDNNPDINVLSVRKILNHILFEYTNVSTVTVFKDDEEGLKNTMMTFEMCANQLYIYLTSIISYDLDTLIEREFASSLDKQFCDDTLNYIKESHSDIYNSMKELFNNVPKREACKLAMKQLVTKYLYNWFNGVLNPMLHNIIDTSPTTLYYIYNDVLCQKLYDNRLSVDESK